MSEPDATERPLLGGDDMTYDPDGMLPTLDGLRRTRRRAAAAGGAVAMLGVAGAVALHLTGRVVGFEALRVGALAVFGGSLVGSLVSGWWDYPRRFRRRERLVVGNRARGRRLARAVVRGRTDHLDADDRRVLGYWAPIARLRAEARLPELAVPLGVTPWLGAHVAAEGTTGLLLVLTVAVGVVAVVTTVAHLVWLRALRRLPDDVAAP